MITLSSGTQLGFDEVVDTLDDSLYVTEKLHGAIGDGLGLSDIGTVIEVTPRLNEIYQDRNTFIAQLKDLDPAESQQVALQLVARRGGSADNIVQVALGAVDLAADWHLAITQNVDLVKRTIEFAKSFGKAA